MLRQKEMPKCELVLNAAGNKLPDFLYKKLVNMYESKKGAKASTALGDYDDDNSSSKGDEEPRAITCSARVNAAIALDASKVASTSTSSRGGRGGRGAKVASTSASSRGGRGGRDGRGATRGAAPFFLRQPAPAARNRA